MAGLPFRSEVLKAKAASNLGGILLVRPPSFALLTGAALFAGLILLVYLALGEYTKKSRLVGWVAPEAGLIRVLSTQGGVVTDRRAVEGELVAAGAPLLVISDARVSSADGEARIAALHRLAQRAQDTARQRLFASEAARGERLGLDARIALLRAELDRIDAELTAQVAKLRLAEDGLVRTELLERRGFLSASQREQKQQELFDQQAREQGIERSRLNLRRELSALEHEFRSSQSRSGAQLAAIDAQLASIDQERIEKESLREMVVVAPQAGTVTALLADRGQAIAAGAIVATILPAGSSLEVHLFAPSRAIGFVHAGQDVQLRYPAYPYQKFGSHRARVASVSRTALPPADLGFTPADGTREPVYRIKLALESQTVTAYGKPEPLQVGMQVEADILLDRRRLIEWVFEPLLSLAGRA